MVNVGSLIAYLKLDTTDFKQGAQAVKQESSSLTGDLTLLAGGFMAVAGASYAAAEKTGGMANDLKDLSYQTGFTTTELQKLQYAAVLTNTNFGTVAVTLNRLTVSMGEAKDKTSAAYKAFMAIGVDPTGKTPKQVFDEVTVALTNMTNEGDRNAATLTLMGKSGKDMLPFMQGYIDKSAEIQKHPTFTKADLQTLEDAKTDWDRLTDSVNFYFAKAVVGIENLQNALNKYNLVKRFFGWDETSIDPSINTLYEPPTGSGSPGLSVTQKLRAALYGGGVSSGDGTGTGAGTGGGGGTGTNTSETNRLGSELFRQFYGMYPIGMTEDIARNLLHASLNYTFPSFSGSDMDTLLGPSKAPTPKAAPAWNQFSNGMTNYDAINPASATPLNLGLTSYTPKWMNTVGPLANKMRNMVGDIQSPKAKARLESYFASQNGTWTLNAWTSINPDDNTYMNPQSLTEQYNLFNDIEPEYQRLTGGPNAKYDTAGNVIIRLELDGHIVTEAMVKKLALLGVKT